MMRGLRDFLKITIAFCLAMALVSFTGIVSTILALKLMEHLE